jgi:hypothetical protein
LIEITPELSLPESDLQWSFSRAGGAMEELNDELVSRYLVV